MKKLKIVLENCYGIDSLDESFDFSKKQTIAIYAPNGVMKTSFAKTFEAVSIDKEPKELLFGKLPTWEILSDEVDIDKNDIVVIKSFVNNYVDKNVSTLLVDEVSKEEYNTIYTDILKRKNSIISKLQKLSGEKQADIENIILRDFDSENFLELIFEKVNQEIDFDFSILKYTDIFDKDVVEFLQKPDVIKNIDDYTEKYNLLIENSKYFKKGIFNPTKADAVLNVLSKENFFKADHKIKLSGDENEILTEEELREKLTNERKTILEDVELTKIENEIKKVSVVKFREILQENKFITELNDLVTFRKKIWISYFHKEIAIINELKDIYGQSVQRLNEIEEIANEQKTTWDEVVAKFNTRFFVPFEVIITNKSSVVLGKSAPNIAITFINPETGQPKEFKREILDGLEVLSQGEKRAMYLLNVIYNVEARKRENKKTLFIIDDIADSFDYKNKYAIVQYLKDISEIPHFYQIILTHNFDFFRTLESRSIVSYANLFQCFKSSSGVRIEKAVGFKNPFINDWKINLSDPKKLIASISFVRNIIEYTKGEEDVDYLTLTNVLHSRLENETIFISDLKAIYENLFEGINFNTELALTDKVVDVIFIQAENCLEADEGINLENKLILSIAIRIQAEKYMLEKLNNPIDVNYSTGKLFSIYKKKHINDLDNKIDLLDEVNLITADNIHLNSFMFEPILDISDVHLKDLYSRIKEIYINE